MHKKSRQRSEEDSMLGSERHSIPLLDSFEGEDINLERKESLFGPRNPYDESGFVSRWLFSWVTPLVRFGYSNKIKLNNLGALPSNYHTSIQEDRVNYYWRKYKHRKGYPLIWAICMAYKGEFLYAFFLSFLSSIPDIFSPFIIQKFLKFIENKDESIWMGILFAFLYVLATFLSRVIQEQGSFYQMQLGSKCSSGVIGLIYSKALLISSATNKDFTQGEMVNFIQVDARKIIMFAWRLPALAKLPIILIYCIIMCFIYFDYTFYSGVIFIVCAIVMNYFTAILTARRQKAVLTAKDSRMRTITETINNIKIIKLNSWIECFIEKIKKLRDKEIFKLRIRFFVSCLNILSIFLLPGFLILTAFGVAIKSGIRMKVSTAFAALQVLNMLRDPTRWLPFFIGMMMEFTVSMKRIQKFLQEEEINQLLIEFDRTRDAEYALSMSRANFSWGGDKIQETKDDKKAKDHLYVQKLVKNEIRERRLSEGKNQQINGSKKYMINEDDEESKVTLDDLHSESESDDLENKEEKKDKLVKEIITLKNINLNIAKGEFV
jgi:ATP-binding cassette, subfamily C (CFTR/MRP), member 1